MSQHDKAEADDGAHLEAALGYLKRGWAVVAAGERTKRPIVPWQAYQHRMPGEAEVTAWFERWPKANLAVITGAISGIVVVDIDPKNGGDRSLAALEARQGPLPATIESITGGGGRHVYFAHPGREVRNRVGLERELCGRYRHGAVASRWPKRPRSRRLGSRPRPPCQRILIRSPRAPRKTKRSPANASRRRAFPCSTALELASRLKR